VDAADQCGAASVVTFWAYYTSVCARAWRDTAAFLKSQVVVNVVLGLAIAGVTYHESAGIGEAFNPLLAVYALIAGSALVVLMVFLLNLLLLSPWRLYAEQVARLRVHERRPDVGRLVELRERGVQLLNSSDELVWLEMDLRDWEAQTLAELRKCATRSDISWFNVLGEVQPRVFAGATPEINREKAMLADRLERLLEIIRRIESGAG
jgi:hypothetical protein